MIEYVLRCVCDFDFCVEVFVVDDGSVDGIAGIVVGLSGALS